MKNRQDTNNYSLHTAILKNGLQDINRPNLYFRNVPKIVFPAVFVTRFYIYPESFIAKYFMLDDLLRENHFHGLKPRHMAAIIKLTYPRTLDFAFTTLQCFLLDKFRPFRPLTYNLHISTLKLHPTLVTINIHCVCLNPQTSG